MIQLVLGKSKKTYLVSSPQITNWGDWGPMVDCSSGSYVTGMRLKVEPDQGDGDDTALNGIELHCTSLARAKHEGNITSLSGTWGNWGNIFQCPADFVAIGLQLRSEAKRGPYKDDTAANNVGMICSDLNRDEVDYIEGDGTEWGIWTDIRFCPKKTAICGLQTQVEGNQGGRDDTTLNNIKVKCCLL